jgi:hypothetical protein
MQAAVVTLNVIGDWDRERPLIETSSGNDVEHRQFYVLDRGAVRKFA